MDVTYRTRAIILDRQPCQEADSRVVAYSWDRGKLELTARGTAKTSSKLAGHLEPFNLVELMVITGRGADYAGAANNLSAAANLKSDWDKLNAGSYVLALYKKVIKSGVGDRKLFLLLAQFVYWLNAVEATPLYYRLVARLAAWKFLNLSGLASIEALPRCPTELKDRLQSSGRSDFVETLKSFKLTAGEARSLIRYLDKIIPSALD